MARIILTLIGVALLAIGLWLTVIWWSAIKIVLLALIALGALVGGITLLVFGISELAGARVPPKSDDAETEGGPA